MSPAPFFATLTVIALAELGDKTQLLTFGFATRYPLAAVMAAVSLATAILMALAVLFGGIINYFIPAVYLQVFAGVLFIGFGLWTIFGREEAEGGKNKPGRHPFLVVFSAFFLAELGDKTQLAALALTAEYGAPFQVWLGATLGMIAVNLLGVLAGGWARNFISQKSIKYIGAAVFILFGLWTLGGFFIY